jgi:hypothetical protein
MDSKYGTFIKRDIIDLKPNIETLFCAGKYLIEIHPFRKTPCEC